MVAEKRISKQAAHDVGLDDEEEDDDDNDGQIRVNWSCLPQVGIWDPGCTSFRIHAQSCVLNMFFYILIFELWIMTSSSLVIPVAQTRQLCIC